MWRAPSWISTVTWRQALTGAAERAPSLSVGWSTWGGLGFVAAALAVLVALAGLYGHPPAWVRPALSGLHQLHSGHIGDYAAWLVFRFGPRWRAC